MRAVDLNLDLPLYDGHAVTLGLVNLLAGETRVGNVVFLVLNLALRTPDLTSIRTVCFHFRQRDLQVCRSRRISIVSSHIDMMFKSNWRV